MARKPNYRFERMERDRQKAAKKAARAKAKAEKSDSKNDEATGIPSEAGELTAAAQADAPVEGSLEVPAAGTPAED